jgi:glycolate oxidase FAD binding subunit
MPDQLKPRDHKDVEAAVQWALASGKSLDVVGHGSKHSFGRPAQYDATLDLSALTGVTLYEPEELILSARAGTPLAEIQALLGSRGQELAFEPMDYGPVFGQPPGEGTVGGTIAANLSGPRRIRAGAARDHFLGAAAVSGRGETFKSGGRVVKNVTGYDLCKLLAGSWGTLAALTEVTLKVLPRAETEATLLAFGLDDRTAVAAMAAAMGTPFGVSAAAHLPDYTVRRFAGFATTDATTAFRIEGVAASVKHCLAGLKDALPSPGAVAVLDDASSRALWRAIRDVQPFWRESESGVRPLWRLSVPPGSACDVVAKLSPATQVFYDWAGGLIWVAPPESLDCSASEIRNALSAGGGHATLVRGPAAARASVDVFQPEAAPLAALTRRIKESFDPKGVLNAGRMWAGV